MNGPSRRSRLTMPGGPAFPDGGAQGVAGRAKPTFFPATLALFLWAALDPSLPAALAAQAHPSPPDEVADFLARAREGTARYRDRRVAILEGYRAVGADAPGMGQHWVNPGLLISGEVDPGRPPILTYISVGERAVLTGVAYARPVAEAGELPADGLLPPEAWHVHGGDLGRESHLPDHRMHAAHGVQTGGIAVLHAWVWLENPAGPFEAENWALPYARLGLVPPPGAPADAARALSLAAGGVGYFTDQLRLFSALDPDRLREARASLERQEERVTGWLRTRPAGRVRPEEVAWLGALWREAFPTAF